MDMEKSTTTQAPTWRGQNVAIVGIGKEGQAMTDYVLAKGASVTVCDGKDITELGEAYSRLRGKQVQWRLGPSHLNGIEQFDVIVRSPGVILDLPSLKKANAKGVIIWSSTKEFFAHCPAPIIGVTGTKGKGTTVSLIAEILKANKRRVHVVGNIGVPSVSALANIKKTDWVVYELSSFQLEDLRQSPHIAVVLGITLDHQDHHKTPRAYFAAKENIVRWQTKRDAAIIAIDYPTTASFAALTPAARYEVSTHVPVQTGAYVIGEDIFRKIGKRTDRVLRVGDIGVKGRHNLENVLPALVAATLAGASLPAIRTGLTSFRGLPHRFEYVATVNDIEYWNNSAGTTKETTAAAVRAFSKPVILLLGGYSRHLPYALLGPDIAHSTVKVVVGIGATAVPMYEEIAKAAAKLGKKPPAYIDGGQTMATMVGAAKKFTKPGDVVLLAPGAPSFDRFMNFEDRGNQFREAVLKATKKSTPHR